MTKLVIRSPLGLQETVDRFQSTQSYRHRLKMDKGRQHQWGGKFLQLTGQVAPPGVWLRWAGGFPLMAERFAGQGFRVKYRVCLLFLSLFMHQKLFNKPYFSATVKLRRKTTCSWLTDHYISASLPDFLQTASQLL